LEELIRLLTQYLQLVKSKTVEKELLFIEMDALFLEAKAYFYLGHSGEGENKAKAFLKMIDDN
jgi:hypothetical protein